MILSTAGVELIKSLEGLSLKSYKDIAGIWTIGYGHTREVKEGDFITKEKALFYLQKDLQWVEKTIKEKVHISLSQSQYDALSSLVYNIGEKAFIASTLLRKLNNGEVLKVADEFLRWIYAGKKVLPGLLRRRQLERKLFLGLLDKPETQKQWA